MLFSGLIKEALIVGDSYRYGLLEVGLDLDYDQALCPLSLAQPIETHAPNGCRYNGKLES